MQPARVTMKTVGLNVQAQHLAMLNMTQLMILLKNMWYSLLKRRVNVSQIRESMVFPINTDMLCKDKRTSYVITKNNTEMMHDENDWGVSDGIFRIPSGTDRIRYFNMQASVAGVNPGNRTAQFCNQAVYIADTLSEAQALVEAYE